MWLVTRALNECNKGSQRILGRVLNSVFNVKAVIATFNHNLCKGSFEALLVTLVVQGGAPHLQL